MYIQHMMSVLNRYGAISSVGYQEKREIAFTFDTLMTTLATRVDHE